MAKMGPIPRLRESQYKALLNPNIRGIPGRNELPSGYFGVVGLPKRFYALGAGQIGGQYGSMKGGARLTASVRPEHLAQIRAMFGRVSRDMKRSLVRAVNRVVDMTWTRAKRELVVETGLRPGIISKMTRKYNAQVRGDEIRGRVWFGSRDVPLIQVGAVQIGRAPHVGGGVAFNSVMVGDRKRGFIRHAFIATMPSRHKGVFLRTKDIESWPPTVRKNPDRKWGEPDLPIYEQKVKSPVAGFYKSHPDRLLALHAFAQRELDYQVLNQAQLVIAEVSRRVA